METFNISTMKLSPRARLLAGVSARALGWRPDDFWSSTPSEMAAILAAQESHEEMTVSRVELNAMMERDGDG